MLCEVITPVFNLFCMGVVVISVVAMGVASIRIERFRVALHGVEGGFIFAVDGDAIVRKPYDRGVGRGISLAIGIIGKVIKVDSVAVKSVAVCMPVEGSTASHMGTRGGDLSFGWGVCQCIIDGRVDFDAIDRDARRRIVCVVFDSVVSCGEICVAGQGGGNNIIRQVCD